MAIAVKSSAVPRHSRTGQSEGPRITWRMESRSVESSRVFESPVESIRTIYERRPRSPLSLVFSGTLAHRAPFASSRFEDPLARTHPRRRRIPLARIPSACPCVRFSRVSAIRNRGWSFIRGGSRRKNVLRVSRKRPEDPEVLRTRSPSHASRFLSLEHFPGAEGGRPRGWLGASVLLSAQTSRD